VFEVEESPSGEVRIQWDVAIPPKAIVFPPRRPNKRKGEYVWSRRLNPMRQWPGRIAKIDEVKDAKAAKMKMQNIRSSLENADDHERWTITSRKQDDGKVGLWACYEGVMTESQFLEYQLERSKRAKKSTQGKLAAQAKRAQALARIRPIGGGLKPPVWRDHDVG
jgi:hypothetical protein